jgi:hypothetical protein
MWRSFNNISASAATVVGGQHSPGTIRNCFNPACSSSSTRGRNWSPPSPAGRFCCHVRRRPEARRARDLASGRGLMSAHAVAHRTPRRYTEEGWAGVVAPVKVPPHLSDYLTNSPTGGYLPTHRVPNSTACWVLGYSAGNSPYGSLYSPLQSDQPAPVSPMKLP